MSISAAFFTLLALITLTLPAAIAHEKHESKRSADPASAPQSQRALKAPNQPKEQKHWGIAGEAKEVNRTITLNMSDDMRFTPDRIDVQEGETVRITLHNRGKVLHEMVIGTKQELDSHAALMLKFPDMEHDEAYMAHVAPGKKGSIIWKFNRPGEFDFACLIAGHYQAGMVGKIRVTPK